MKEEGLEWLVVVVMMVVVMMMKIGVALRPVAGWGKREIEYTSVSARVRTSNVKSKSEVSTIEAAQV
jgi:hypothetical protein